MASDQSEMERQQPDLDDLTIEFGEGFSHLTIRHMMDILDEHGLKTENFEIRGGRPSPWASLEAE